jgi:hypothetical protein
MYLLNKILLYHQIIKQPQILGIEIARITLDVGQSQEISEQADQVAKIRVTITFESNGIRVDGRGCVKFFIGSWRCRSFNFWLIQW